MDYMKADTKNPYMGLDNKICENQSIGANYIKYGYQIRMLQEKDVKINLPMI